MYVIILEHPSCVTGNDVHTRVHLFRAFILQILVNRGVFIHSYLQESSLCIKTSTLGKKCGDLFSYFVNFPVDNFKKKNLFLVCGKIYRFNAKDTTLLMPRN